MLFLFSLLMFFASLPLEVAQSAINPSPVPVAQVTAQPEQEQAQGESADVFSTKVTLLTVGITSFFVVGGWITTHILTLKREREARSHADKREKEACRAELLATLHFWLQTLVVETDPAKLKDLYYFGGAMKELSAAAAKFRGWATDKATFDRLNYVSNMNPESLDAAGINARRDTVCGALNTFIQFVREA
jgi:hypothetical protein